MKNIHVLPTPKPSRLIHNVLGYAITLIGFTKSDLELIQAEYQNIYITSDEEIKEGDFYITQKGTICLCRKVDVKYFVSIEEVSEKENCKKIILTTDQDLIKDGVQSIDDEFLEWFVKNPSCEYVIFERLEDGKYVDYLSDGSTFEGIYENYKIIIPQEEVLLQSSIDGEPIWGEAPKQETLEEFIKKQLSLGKYQDQESAIRHSIELGAKWQQEQDKNKHSDAIDSFITEIKTEFKDENWDYLDFIKERVLTKFKNK